MTMLTRILLYLATNLLVVLTVSLLTNALGLHSYLHQNGIDYQTLAIFCLVWGMSSSVIALWMSRWMARLFMNVKLVDTERASLKERELVQKVRYLAWRSGLTVMPQVGIYRSNEVNAFATGPTKNRALVAVSSGLLTRMSADELEGVLAHELSHVSNGDMVTMTLLQGVINAFSLFLSRIIAYLLSTMFSRSREKDDGSRLSLLYPVLVVVCDLAITLLGSMVLAAFSRYREYRADKGGSRLVGRHKMIAALEKLRGLALPCEREENMAVLSNLKLNQQSRKSTLLSLLATHPDIDLRIAALRV